MFGIIRLSRQMCSQWGGTALIALLVGVSSSAPCFAANAKLGLSPDNGQSFLLQTIEQAQQELVLNFYQFEEPQILEAVKRRIRAGVSVSILAEGSPVGGFTRGTANALTEIADLVRNRKGGGKEAGKGGGKGATPSRVALMRRPEGGTRRYTYNHAKFAVIDRRVAFVSSENVKSGAYVPAGRIGNRGWHVALTDPSLVNELLNTFETDLCRGCADVWDVLERGVPAPTAPPSPPKPGQDRTLPIQAALSTQVRVENVIAAPRALAGLVEVIDQARSDLDLQFLSLPPTWTLPGQNRVENPVVASLRQASARGVKVRVLLNDERVFWGANEDQNASKTNRNLETVCALYRFSQTAPMALDARIVNIRAAEVSYIHNKGILADGNRVLVSSINGTMNSIEKNREVGVVFSGEQAHAYYKRAFDLDWNQTPQTTVADCTDAGARAPNIGFLEKLLSLPR